MPLSTSSVSIFPFQKSKRRIDHEDHQFAGLLPGIYIGHLLKVQDEIIEALAQFRHDDHAYYERRRVHKAYYSLDLDDGIENTALFREPSPQEIYEQEIADQEFVRGHQKFIRNAGKRIRACFLHGMSKAAIAKVEDVCASTVCPLRA